MRPIYTFLLCSLMSLLSFHCALADHYEIVAFGDSLTQGLHRNKAGHEWGIRTPQSGTRLSATNGEDGYSPVLEVLIAEGSQGKTSAYVYNWGYRGELTLAGVNRITSVLNARPTDFILLMEGANDLYHGVSPYTTQYNLGVMVDKSLSHGVKVILASVSPNTESPFGPVVHQFYFPLIGALADEKNVPFVDMYNPMAGRFGELWPPLHSGDGLHLNAHGYSFMAQLWYNVLKTQFKKKPVPNAYIHPLLLM